MKPRELWDVENIFDLVENNHNEFENTLNYDEYRNGINDTKFDIMNNDFFI